MGFLAQNVLNEFRELINTVDCNTDLELTNSADQIIFQVSRPVEISQVKVNSWQKSWQVLSQVLPSSWQVFTKSRLFRR